jgi:nitrate/nitrite transport system substrate-binding protein
LDVDFFDQGRVNYPYVSDGLWFLSQFVRWGMIRAGADWPAIVETVNQTSIYRAAARSLDIAIPTRSRRESLLMDGRIWNGDDVDAYARGFPIRAR